MPVLSRAPACLVVSLVAGLVALPGLAAQKPKDPHAVPADATAIVPASSVHIRSSIDDNPRPYLGRFVPDGAGAEVDDSAAMTTACGGPGYFQEASARSVGNRDEYFHASTAARGNLGIPGILEVSGGGGGEAILRVVYQLTGKLIAVPDGAKLDECCRRNPTACTARFVGEYLQGTGKVYRAVGREGDVKLGGLANTFSGGLEFKDGWAWTQAFEWKEPMYFAFKLGGRAQTGGTDWANGAVPFSTTGHYFVGVSNPMPSEQSARDDAMQNARQQVVRWLGTEIVERKVQVGLTEGQIQALRVALQSDQQVTVMASGIARHVKDQDWHVENQLGSAGPRFIVRVLAFLPQAEEGGAGSAMAASAAVRP